MNNEVRFFAGGELIADGDKSKVEKLAKEGDLGAIFKIARFYAFKGKFTKAYKYAERFGKKSDCFGQYDIGMFYHYIGLHYKAVYWLTISANNGDDDAKSAIQTFYNIEIK